ncbi:MAG: zinc-dependent metalloprotease [Armatimonadetes bacterium]|nr:zinc-dependent metalloprotease [Armatimonadota bacterium]
MPSLRLSATPKTMDQASRPRTRAAALTVALIFAATVVAAPTAPLRRDDKVVLRLKGSVGQSAVYKAEWQMSLQAGPGKVVIGTAEETQVTVKEVAADGGLTTEHKTLSSKTTINGQLQPEEESHGTTTIKQSPNGSIVSYQDSESDADDPNKDLNIRLSQAGTIVFSDQAVGVGDKWKITLAADKASGRRAAKADYEIIGTEDLKGAKCFKIKLDYTETEGELPIHQTGVALVEIASGDTLQDEFKIAGLAIKAEDGDMRGDAAGRSGRQSGTLLAGAPSQAAPTKPADTAPQAKPTTEAFDAKVKGFDKSEGVFTLYKQTKDGRTKAYLEIKEDQLNKPLLLQATAATGTGDGRLTAGDPLADLVFEFRKSPTDKLFMTVPNSRFRTADDTPMARALKRSFADTNLDAFGIEAKNPDRKSLLVDISNLFMNDIGQVTAHLMGTPMFGGPPGGPYVMDREKTYVASMKALPANLAVRTVYSFIGGRGPSAQGGSSTLADPRGTIAAVEFSLAPLPVSNGYRTRAYDQRIGYFTADFDDYSRDTKLERKKQLIVRWDMRKKDPAAAVSEPVKPIEFWISNDVPLEYRDAVKEGILSWNPAFEKAGFKNAITVQQMPDNAEWDPADVRFNVIRWVTSPDDAYAVSYPRVNPLTGQILNAQIVVDANMTRGVSAEKQFIVNPEAIFNRLDPNRPMPLARSRCEIGPDGQMIRTVGMLAASDLGLVDEQEYVRQALRHTVAHEMGHILGLRHNFAASTTYTLSELGDAKQVSQTGAASSVMDYLPFNLSAVTHKGAPFYVAKPGVYDEWAISYGYTVFPTTSAQDDKGFLDRLASQTGEPGKAYLSDEFADGVDPDVSRFDLAKDPIKYWTEYAGLLRTLTVNLKDKAPRQGDSYFDLTRRYFAYLNQSISAAAELTRFVGGVEKAPFKKGDAHGRPPIRPVAAETQRLALSTLNRLYLGPDAFDFPKELYSYFQSNPAVTEEEGMVNTGEYFPVVQRYMLVQRLILRTVLGAGTTSRVLEQEFKAKDPSSTLTLSELYDNVLQSVWAETAKSQDVNPMRRQLQRAHLQTIIDAATGKGSGPEETRAIAWGQLKEISKKVKAAQAKAKGATKLHYDECLARIDRAVTGKDSSGGQLSLRDLLGG